MEKKEFEFFINSCLICNIFIEKYILLLKIETKINIIKIISLITNLVFDNTDYKNTMLVHYPDIISQFLGFRLFAIDFTL